MQLDQVIKEFFAYLRTEKDCSDLTVKAYKNDFNLFNQFLISRGITQVEGITPRQSGSSFCA